MQPELFFTYLSPTSHTLRSLRRISGYFNLLPFIANTESELVAKYANKPYTKLVDTIEYALNIFDKGAELAAK